MTHWWAFICLEQACMETGQVDQLLLCPGIVVGSKSQAYIFLPFPSVSPHICLAALKVYAFYEIKTN